MKALSVKQPDGCEVLTRLESRPMPTLFPRLREMFVEARRQPCAKPRNPTQSDPLVSAQTAPKQSFIESVPLSPSVAAGAEVKLKSRLRNAE